MSTHSITLAAAPGIASPAKAGEALPKRIKLLAWGANPNIYGAPIVLDDALAASFAAAQKAIGRERIALDFEHNTVEGSPEWQNSNEPRAIAAQGTPMVVAGEGLFLDDLTWTKTGTAHAADYEDVSPALYLVDGRVAGIHSAALTRTGAVHGLTFQPYSAGIARELTLLSASLTPAANPNKDTNMPDTTPAPAPDLAALIARLDALEAAVAALQQPDACLKTMSARIEAIETARATAEANGEKTQRANLVAQASREGKIIPLSAGAVETVPLAVLKDIVDNMPKGVVPLNASAKPGTDAPATFSARVADLVKGGKTKGAAVQAAIAADPEGYKTWRQSGGNL